MNIVFRASAGTGKTYQVTNLYVALLLGRPYKTTAADGKSITLHQPGKSGSVDPRRVLLMTFTENAAAELRTRVTQLILKARHEAEDREDTEEIERTVRILRALPAAPICTIHSFCASFLREHALEAGISPGFAVMDQEEAGSLLEEVANEELLARLNPAENEAENRFDPDFALFCRGVRVMGGEYGNTVVDVVQSLLRQADSKGMDLRNAEAMLPDAVHTVARADFEKVLESLKSIRALRNGDLPGKAGAVFQALENLIASFPNIGKTADDALLAAAGDLNPGFSGKDGLSELSARLKDLVARAAEVTGYRKHLSAIRAFARYAAAVADRYAERKRQQSVLDFDDLLTRARDLLVRTGNKDPIYDTLIVDEVQDTSRVQCEILNALWMPPRNELIICGDTKQSIYAWRNADPSVMPDLESRILAQGTQKKVALRASFRSKDSILELVNRLFARVYGSAYDEDEQLVPCTIKNAQVRAQGETPCVEFLSAPWETAEAGEEVDVPEHDDRIRQEMMAVARRVRMLVDGAPDWQPRFRYSGESERFEPVGGGNRFRYADVLILLRRTTYQQTLEHILRTHHIPYRIGGRGKGLFARPEVKDALLFFKALTHPLDTISLIGFLRSPWIGLTDETILQLGWRDSEFDEAAFRARLEGGPMPEIVADAEQLERFARARDIVARYRRRADYYLASEVLRDLIQETGYDAILAGTFRGGQRVSNLRKLIDWLRDAEHGGTVLLADVCAALQENADTPPDIPEATLLDPDQNAVTIMTIHGAKGLTARVVFVPELSTTPRGDTPWAVLEGDGTPGTPPPVLHVRTEDLVRNRAGTPGFDRARDDAKAIRDAESRNVFYVAMTRARDLVVLSGSSGARKPSGWREQFDALMLECPDAGPLVRRIGYRDLDDAFLAGPGAKPARAPMEFPSRHLLETAGTVFPGAPAGSHILRFPATILSAFLAAPETYAAQRLAGLEPAWLRHPPLPGHAERTGDESPAGADRDEVGSFAAFGKAGHAVLERAAMAGWKVDMEALVRAMAEEAGLTPPEERALSERIRECAGIVTELARGATDLRTEWPFAMTAADEETILIVDGTIDLLFQDPQGDWHVVDYKFTDQPSAALLKQYAVQLNLYRDAVARMTGRPERLAAAHIVAISRTKTQLVDVPADLNVLRKTVGAALRLEELAGLEPGTAGGAPSSTSRAGLP